MIRYLIQQKNHEDFRVMNQNGVKQVIVNEPNHNACWDARLSSDGKFYFSVCSEHTCHEYAKLYKYDFDSNTAEQCFYTKDFLLKSDRYLRDSKFHTSICEKPDGKLIIVTHSTDKSPCHPAWLPYSFVSNPFEGFPGGELMEYDPKTGKVELFGIPAPRETIYGAVYSKKDDAYYMLGWMRGHLYRFDCATRKCEDLGQASEYRSYRIVVGPDENIYWSTKSGFMMRYNVELKRIEDLKARIPCDKVEFGKKYPFTYLGPCPIGPDGRMYLTGNYTDILSALDPKTGRIEKIGRLIPAQDYIDIEDQHTFVAGMDFDREGVLWYATMSFRYMEDEHYKAPSGFFRWDFLHGKAPEFLGLFGTPERVQTYTDSLYIDKDRDILYSASTNHSYGSPDIIAVDLKRYRTTMYDKGPMCKDMLVFAPGHPEFHPFAEHWQDIKMKIAEYAANFKSKKIAAVRLWVEFSDTDISRAAIKGLKFVGDDVVGICGNQNNDFKFTISHGEITEIKEATEADTEDIIKIIKTQAENLPFYPGRQWRRGISAECQWRDGCKLVGTEDGFLAKIMPDGKVFSLGPAVCQGPIRDLTSNIDVGVAYGVGGDKEDIGNVFKYTDEEGLIYLGYMCCDVANDQVGVCANFNLSSCAISDDGTKLAIGSDDRLACAYICELQ